MTKIKVQDKLYSLEVVCPCRFIHLNLPQGGRHLLAIRSVDRSKTGKYNAAEVKYYYSTLPFLAWCLNHYFYNKKHFAWVAPFYPYRLYNPKSSCPYLIYQDLYMPWKDGDDYDKYMNQIRINLKKGVEKRQSSGSIFNATEMELKDICDKVEILFLYPIVYRVDIEKATVKSKLEPTDWSKKGSDEYGVDLDEGEFDLLFLDYDGNTNFNDLKDTAGKLTHNQALAILKRRCKP